MLESGSSPPVGDSKEISQAEKACGFEEIFKELKETSAPRVDPNFNYNLGSPPANWDFWRMPSSNSRLPREGPKCL